MALLGKWAWRMQTMCSGQWREVITTKYFGPRNLDEDWDNLIVKWLNSRWWRYLVEWICTAGWFNDRMRRVMGDGEKTRFWEDDWLGTGKLTGREPNLYLAAADKGILVADKWVLEGEDWRICRYWYRPLSYQEEDLLWEMEINISDNHPTESPNTWRWQRDYTLPVVDGAIQLEQPSSVAASTNLSGVWGTHSPFCVMTFCWRVFRLRIATIDNLIHRGVERFQVQVWY